MKSYHRIVFVVWASLCAVLSVAQPHYNLQQMNRERLDRGVVAVRDGRQVIVSWRILSSDAVGEPFDLYRNGQKLNVEPLTGGGSFYIDWQPLTTDATYEVRGGGKNGSFTLKRDAPDGYLPVRLQKPDDGITPDGERYGYSANDASVADVDGDGQYEIVLKWDPSNAHDNAHDGYTGNTLFDCYRLDGTLLWRIDMGINIRSGAHYVPFIFYDLDGDGRAELIVRTSDGTRDGTGQVIGEATADYRHRAPADGQNPIPEREWGKYNKPGRPMTGRILTGNEYITVFDGLTGKAMDTRPYIPERGSLSDWGDNYANRSDRMLAAVGYLDGRRASAIFCRGYYTRTVIAAWDWDGRELKPHWVFDTNDEGIGKDGKPQASYAGQGNHNLRIADVDGDGCDEITYGSMAVDHDGRGLYNTGMGHGDAIHLTAFDPSTTELQVWDCHENRRDGSDLRNARTGEVIFQVPSRSDVGRCMAADIDPTNPGVEMWSTDSHGIRNIRGEVIYTAHDPDDPQHQQHLILGGRHLSVNFGIWWDGDLLRELLDHETVTKYDWRNHTIVDVVRFPGIVFNNGTKSNPCLAADILGDWREEVIARTPESDELRIFVSPIPTDYRINCLMEDMPYRLSTAAQNVGYNQPSEPGFYLGPDKTVNPFLKSCTMTGLTAQKGNYQTGDYGYLFCHMNDRGRAWTAYALSRDGLHYHDLLGGDSIFSDHEHARIEGATRDAYICRKHDGSGYLMACTDMNVGRFKELRKQAEWDNYGICLLRSDDLIHWESKSFDYRQGPGIFCNPKDKSVYKDWSTINRVWAPQIMWDEDYLWPDGQRGGYFVYYSMWNRAEEKYDRMYYSYADETFTRLTQPRLLFDWGYATIDADINWVEADRLWHMMIKKEGGRPGLFTATAPALTGPWSEPVDDDYVSFEGNKKCEGVSAFQLAGRDDWMIGYIEYSSKPRNYRLCMADRHMRNFHSPRNIEGVARPQHGSFLRLTKEEYDRLQAWTGQTLNDNNTPLHLMTPAYRIGYGVSKPEEVKEVMDRVLRYIEAETPAQLVDKHTGEPVTDLRQATADTQLKQGGFRLTSYEWGVTYSGALAAWQATGDKAYLDYVTRRHRLLADIAPVFKKIYATNKQIDGNIRRVIDPHALDDAGAVCCSMIKSELVDSGQGLRPLIDNYVDYIMNKEYRLSDGTFARIRPQNNTLWLDDMFMGIPAVAYMGKLTGDTTYYDEAARQVLQFAQRMWVPEVGLFRHGWVESMDPHPAFHWGRANGWAILTMCEVLDVLPAHHPRRAEILQLLRAHAASLARLQHHDGFWHQLLNRNDTYLEASATAIYTYCLAHAVNQGWIDAKAYGPVAQLGWHAVASSVNRKGQVEQVCVGTGMGFDPAFYAYRPCHVMAAHGYGPVLWAGAEIINLLRQQHPKPNDSAVMFYDQEVNTDAPIFNYDGSIRF